MDIQKLMKQAQEMQAGMQKTQEELANKNVEASVGGGKVTVVANGSGDVQSISIYMVGKSEPLRQSIRVGAA